MPTELLVASAIVLVLLVALLLRRSGSDDGAAADETVLSKRFIDAEYEKWKKVVAVSGAKLEQ